MDKPRIVSTILMAAIVAMACLYIIAVGDRAAMEQCQARHSLEVCRNEVYGHG